MVILQMTKGSGDSTVQTRNSQAEGTGILATMGTDAQHHIVDLEVSNNKKIIHILKLEVT